MDRTQMHESRMHQTSQNIFYNEHQQQQQQHQQQYQNNNSYQYLNELGHQQQAMTTGQSPRVPIVNAPGQSSIHQTSINMPQQIMQPVPPHPVQHTPNQMVQKASKDGLDEKVEIHHHLSPDHVHHPHFTGYDINCKPRIRIFFFHLFLFLR